MPKFGLHRVEATIVISTNLKPIWCVKQKFIFEKGNAVATEYCRKPIYFLKKV